MAAADPIDAAIDAVVRAVDRIERSTRAAQDAALAVPPAGAQTAPPVPSAGPVDSASFVEPVSTAALAAGLTGEPSGKHGKKGKKARAAEAEQVAAVAAIALQQALAQQRLLTDAGPSPAAAGRAPAEVHELVGKLVARSQQLDEQLGSAQRLRDEIAELVARLAAATER